MDVFISHHGGDTKRGFSAWLSRDLKRATFTCFFDERSLHTGDPSWATITRELSQAKVVVVVLSPGFFTSKHCLRELHQRRGQGKQVVPIFFDITPDGCQPAALADKVPAVPWDGQPGDWDGSDWEEDVKWIKNITGLRLEALDGFWDTCVDRTVQDVARLLGRPVVDLLTKVDTTPFANNAGFVGREKELEDLAKILGGQGKVFVTGLGGMGKTQLVLEYVNRHKSRFAKVLWIDGASQSLLANFLGLAEHMGVSLKKEGSDAEGENVRRVRGALEKAEAPYLLVVDNLDDGADVWDMLPRDGLCQTLVSTRLDALDDMKGLRLSELDDLDALKLLRGETEALSTDDLRTLAENLGRLTLALAVSSRILREGVTPKELLEKLRERGVEVFNDERMDRKYKIEPNLVRLFDISMELVKREDSPKSRLAVAMVKVGGWFASARIPFRLLTRAGAELSPDLRETDGPDAFRLLVRYSLGARKEDAFFHQLVREYGRFLGGQEAGKAVVKALIAESGSVDKGSALHFQNACDLTIPGRRRTDINLEEDVRLEVIEHVAIPLVRYYVGADFRLAQARTLVSTLPEDFDTPPSVCSSSALSTKLYACRARVLDMSGEFSTAYQLYERALHIKERSSVHDGVQCDGCMTSPVQGLRYKSLDRDDYDLCANCKDKHSTKSERFILIDHPDVAGMLNNMAGMLLSQGKYEEALSLFERSLGIREKALGPEHQVVAISLNNMAGLLERQGKYAEALPLYERSLGILE